MEEFSGDSTLCKKKDNTLDEVKEVVHVKQDAPPPSSFLPNSSGLQSLFVKACGVNISVQVDLSNTKVDYLINSACQKMRVNVKDTYAVLCGKILEYNKPMTFDEKFDDIHANTWFYTVDLVPALQRQTRTNPPVLPWLSVRYFSDFASYNIQKVLNHITAMHWENLSYNGAFNSDNIIFHNGAVTIQGVLTVQFNGVTCAKDFAKLYSIFIAKFTPHGIPLYFNDLLEYLRNCPNGENSNDEAIVAFIINHPCLQSYLERMSQLEHLDNIYPRHPGHSTTNISALGTFSWQDKVVRSQNYVFMLHEVEAAFSNCLEEYLPHVLKAIARLAQHNPQGRQYLVDVKQQSGGAANESYLASLMEASWRDGGMLEYKEKQP
uniref:Ubiquitin-like domain-containing protein n=1 Tax=Oryza rufipogon TaxID=4529 RepID=A0A0E0MS88_ORYRU